MELYTAVTVIMGLSNIIKIIGKIGPLKVMLFIFIAITAIYSNPSGIVQTQQTIPSLKLMKASSNWFFAALSYVGFCMLWLAAFMASWAKKPTARKRQNLEES